MVSPLRAAVCLVQPTFFPEASRVDIYEYGCALARLGVETHVIVSGNRAAALPQGLVVHETGFAPRNTPAAWWRFASKALGLVSRLASVGLVHLFNPSPATWLLGWRLRRAEPRPRIVYDLRTGGLGHGPDALLIDWMARTAPRFADAMVALSTALGARLAGEGRFREVPLGVNLDSFRLRARPARATDEFVFIYAGTLSRNRALHHMLSAFEQLQRGAPHARLRIVGDGDDRARLEALAGARRMAVSFLGPQPPAAIPALLAEADCGLAYVPDTPWFQPQPQLKTLEYFASGLPAVAVRTAGNRALWGDLPRELLTGERPEEFAAGMRFALENRAKLPAERFRRVAEPLSWERITAERLIPVYEELLGRRS